MCESRAVPSGKVYRQLFDAQVQLSRSLLAGRRDKRTQCLSAKDSNTHCSTASSRGQHLGPDDDDDVGRLPDAVVVEQSCSNIIGRLTEKKSKKYNEALKQFETELTELTQVCETQVRTVSLELLSSLQEVDLRLNTLKDRMEHLEHVSLQEVCALWQEVEEEMNLKKIRIMELNLKLTESETERTNKIRTVLCKYRHLLEKISFQPPSEIYRMIHTEAMMLNQSLLANHRCVTHLMLTLQEENVLQASLLRLHWEECLSSWRTSKVNEVVDHFRLLTCSVEDQQLVSVQQKILERRQTQRALTEQRCDIISKISSLVPPSCSTALVSDWFNQLSAVNQQIESCHADFLHQLHCCCEQKWQDRLAEVERCKEALSVLQLSEEDVNNIVSSQILPLIGQSQSQDEEQLAALDLRCDAAAHQALTLSRCVFVVLRGAALLWETHSHRLEKREGELQQHLDDLRASQQQHVQMKKVRIDDLLAGLRQESSEGTLKTSLDKTVDCLQDIKHSFNEWVSDQCQLLDRLPSLWLEELLSYSRSLSSFFHLNHAYMPSPEELGDLHQSSSNPTEPKTSEEMIEYHPINCQIDIDPAQLSQDWLTEAESSLLNLCDISSDVVITSSRGVTYTGPAFRCPAPDLPDDLQQETHLSLFPMELLTHTLRGTRTLFLDHLEQHIHDILSSAVAMVTNRKETVRLEQELHLKQLKPEHIQSHIYQPRLAELQLHRQRVDVHCEEVLDMLTSCRVELQELQTSISRKNEAFTVLLSNMEQGVLTAASSQRLDAVSSALQDCVDQHTKYTQSCETTFRQTAQTRLEEARNRTTQLLSSFRLFSEGGDFAPQEVKLFQQRLKEESKHISVTEESIYSELEVFESSSLQEVKEVSTRLEEKLLLLQTEVKFRENIQKVLSSTQVQLKAEAASSNQQQSAISSRLDDLRRMMDDTQVRPDQVCSYLSSVNEDLMKRCQYLDLSLESLSAYPKSRRQVQPAPPSVALLPSRTGVDLHDDPVVGMIRSLNRFCVIQDSAAEPDDRGTSPVQHLQHTSTETVSKHSVRRGCRSIRTDGRFQVFGAEPEQNPDSFSSIVTSVLWKANDTLLMVAEDLYRSERSALTGFLLLPDTLDQWADSMQQRLLGYQEQTRKFLSTSREELVDQLSVLDKLLCFFPSVLINNHEQHQGVGLRETVGGVRKKLEETLAASEKEKCEIVRQLRVSLRDDELQSLTSREELRQQQLHSAICCAHLQLQECVRVRGEEFVTSLASLTENLLHQLDNVLTPAETEVPTSHQHSDDSTVTMETKAGQNPCMGSRTWSGILYFSSPTNSSVDLQSSVTIKTSSIATTRCTMGHQAVIEQRDAAVKRFEQLFRSELSRSHDDKRRQLRDLQSWNTHWTQQIHTLKHTLERL